MSYDCFTVHEIFDRVGLRLFSDDWCGQEYKDHHRLGLWPKPATKQRGVQAEREILRQIEEGKLQVLVLSGDELVPAPKGITSFVASEGTCAGDDGAYRHCILKHTRPTKPAGRKTETNYPEFVNLALSHVSEVGPESSIDRLTNSIINKMERKKLKPPAYSKAQPFARVIRQYFLNKKDSRIQFRGSILDNG